MTKTIDIKDFADRVERLCDFFIAKKSESTGRDGSKDLIILEDLKNDAADIHFGRVEIVIDPVAGLHDHMNGVG